MMSRARSTDPIATAGMVGGVALIAGLIALAEQHMPVPNLSILFLLPVMFSAVTWGWWNALGASVLAFLAYDFLFVDPHYTFTISDPEEWLALIIFLVVSAVTSNLAARERARREQASRQAWTATFLYDVSRALGESGLDAGLRSVSERLHSEFRMDGVVVARSDPEGRLTPLVAVGRADGALGSEPAGRTVPHWLAGQRSGPPDRGAGAWQSAGRPGIPCASCQFSAAPRGAAIRDVAAGWAAKRPRRRRDAPPGDHRRPPRHRARERVAARGGESRRDPAPH